MSENGGPGGLQDRFGTGFEAKDWRATQHMVPTPDTAARRSVSGAAKWLLRAKPGNHAQECVRARAIMTEARGLVKGIHESVANGERIDPRTLDPVVDAIAASIQRDPTAIPSVTRLKLRHEYTFYHSVAVCGLMVGLARALRLDEAEMHQIGLAGLLHDIGKARIPNALLNKPGPLDDKEFALVREHTVRGHEILCDAGGVSDLVLDVVLNHHERIDGRGYPARKSGPAISVHARMGAVCDVYDAVTSARSYKPAWSPGEAQEWMRGTEGHFDRAVMNAFAKTVGAFPYGSLVRLAGDRLGVVLDPGQGDPLDPPVMIFMDAASKRPLPPLRIDRAGRSIVAVEYAERLGIPDWTATRTRILRDSGATLRPAA